MLGARWRQVKAGPYNLHRRGGSETRLLVDNKGECFGSRIKEGGLLVLFDVARLY